MGISVNSIKPVIVAVFMIGSSSRNGESIAAVMVCATTEAANNNIIGSKSYSESNLKNINDIICFLIS